MWQWNECPNDRMNPPMFFAWLSVSHWGSKGSTQDCCKTSNGVRGWDVGSEESAKEDVGCGGNEEVELGVWRYKDGQNKKWKNWRDIKSGTDMWGRVVRMGVEGRRRKGRLKWRWMDSVNVDLRVMRMDVEGRRRKGRLKHRWMDSANVDLREKGLSGEETQTGLCGGNLSET